MSSKRAAGIQSLLDLIRFDEVIKDADLIVTGEGRADEQSCHGKAMQGIGLAGKKADIPVIALCGSVEPGAEGLKECGIKALFEMKPKDMPVSEAMERAEELYLEAAEKMFEEYALRDDFL